MFISWVFTSGLKVGTSTNRWHSSPFCFLGLFEPNNQPFGDGTMFFSGGTKSQRSKHSTTFGQHFGQNALDEQRNYESCSSSSFSVQPLLSCRSCGLGPWTDILAAWLATLFLVFPQLKTDTLPETNLYSPKKLMVGRWHLYISFWDGLCSHLLCYQKQNMILLNKFTWSSTVVQLLFPKNGTKLFPTPYFTVSSSVTDGKTTIYSCVVASISGIWC